MLLLLYMQSWLEGDAITYEWDGRDKETATYGYGKHLVKCRAVDGLHNLKKYDKN